MRKWLLKQSDAHIDALRLSPLKTLHEQLRLVGDGAEETLESRVAREGRGWVILV